MNFFHRSSITGRTGWLLAYFDFLYKNLEILGFLEILTKPICTSSIIWGLESFEKVQNQKSCGEIRWVLIAERWKSLLKSIF